MTKRSQLGDGHGRQDACPTLEEARLQNEANSKQAPPADKCPTMGTIGAARAKSHRR